MSRYIALTCEALARSVYAASANSPHTVTARFFRQGLHNTPKVLRSTLQDAVDAIQPGECDAILLAYGLCGGSTAGLTARHTPLVLPRAHDCITLYLGSRERYQEEFERHPGTYWYSTDYMERQEPGAAVTLGAAGIGDEEAQYDAWVARWGVETADMLREEMQRWSKHYTRAAFIDTGLGNEARYEAAARAKAETSGWVFERLKGNRRLIEMLAAGEWPEEEFLVIPPGSSIEQVMDERIVGAKLTADQPIPDSTVQDDPSLRGQSTSARRTRRRGDA
jgi:hypothetical protein